MSGSQNIVLLSNEPWGEVWFSKQHYANELAKLGHSVYFVNPTQKWKFSNLLKWEISSRIEFNNLFVLSYSNLIPGGGVLSRLINDFLFCLKLKLFLKGKTPLFWNFDPFRLSSIFFFKKSKYIYHVVDRYLFKSDLRCAEQANIIPLVTKEYRNRYAKWHEKVFHIPHGISDQEFKIESSEVEALQEKYGSYFLFVGTFHNGLDIDLLTKIASRFPEYNMVLVGPLGKEIVSSEIEQLKERENVKFVGKVPSDEIKNYISGSLTCLIPYKIEEAYRTQTLKSLHYLAQKKPIISIPLRDWNFLEGTSFYFGETHDEFLSQITQITNKQKGNRLVKLDEYLDSVRYPILIEKIFKKLEAS